MSRKRTTEFIVREAEFISLSAESRGKSKVELKTQ